MYHLLTLLCPRNPRGTCRQRRPAAAALQCPGWPLAPSSAVQPPPPKPLKGTYQLMVPFPQFGSLPSTHRNKKSAIYFRAGEKATKNPKKEKPFVFSLVHCFCFSGPPLGPDFREPSPWESHNHRPWNVKLRIRRPKLQALGFLSLTHPQIQGVNRVASECSLHIRAHALSGLGEAKCLLVGDHRQDRGEELVLPLQAEQSEEPQQP